MSLGTGNTEEHQEPHRRKQRSSHASLTVILISLIFCLLVLCGAGYYGAYVLNQAKAQAQEPPGLKAEGNVKTGTLSDPAGRQAELDEIVREGLITFSINATPSLKTGDGEANLLIENPPDNGTRFTVTINRDDTGEEIYKSGYLDPEQYIDNTPLDVTLGKGEYPCTAYFDSYRISDSSYLGRAAAKITIYVLN